MAKTNEAKFLNILDTLSPSEETVSFKDFVTGQDFCNASGVYDYWLEKGDSLDDPEELILDGSLGGGKTTFATYYMAYRVYKLVKIANFRKLLGIIDNSMIHILYFSVSMSVAKASGFQLLSDVFDNCKWFQTHFPRDKSISSVLRFPDNLEIKYASSEGHQISLNVIAFILDEGNFRSGVGLGNPEEYLEVTRLYNQLIDRQITRFATPSGSRAWSILISSASYQSSFVEKRKELAKSNKTSAVITSVSYEVKPQNYSKEKFEVFVGTGTVSPCIVKDAAHKALLIKKISMEGLPDSYELLFRQPPLSIKKVFEGNIALALQNHCGVPTKIEGRLFSNMDIVKKVLNFDPPQWFPDTTFSLSNKDDFNLMDVIDLNAITHSERPHSFFLDLSVSSDPGGFSCYRNDSYEEDGKLIRKHTHIFTLSIQPPPFPGETMISKFFDFLIFLSEHVNVAAFASDQYQSKMLRQEIQEYLELPDSRFSIDSSDEFFLHWMRGMVEGTCDVINDPRLIDELETLLHNLKTRRVIKSKTGTDDISQSVCGAYFLSSVYTSHDEGIDLSELRRNLVGAQAVKRMQRAVGF